MPGLTAWLVRLGTTLAGTNVFGLRWPFLLLGAALPWMVVRIARHASAPREGDDHSGDVFAWQAGTLAVLLPLGGLLGLLAFRAHARLYAAIGHSDAIIAQHRLATLAAGRFRAFHATPLGLLLRTAKQEDRSDQQQAGGQDADAQQCRVGHSIGSPASSFR